MSHRLPRILIVDDDKSVREINVILARAAIKKEFKIEPHIDSAESVDEAIIKYITPHHIGAQHGLVGYEAVVTDLTMPLKSGIDFYREVRYAEIKYNTHYNNLPVKDPQIRLPHRLPFLFISGYTAQERDLGEILQEDPLTRFLQKPYRVEQLQDKIVDLIRAREGGLLKPLLEKIATQTQ